VARRADPERFDAARHAAVRNSLISDGASEETADAWIAAWEARADQDGLDLGTAYWDAGWEWIAERRKTRSCRHRATFDETAIRP
jgi:hypothetical protein